MSELTLAAIDRDEVLGEAIEAFHGSTRAGFLRSAALGGTAMLSALATPTEAAAGVSDVEILQFGLRFERLQATFYTQADEMGTIGRMSDAKRRWARTWALTSARTSRSSSRSWVTKSSRARSSPSETRSSATTRSRARPLRWRI